MTAVDGGGAVAIGSAVSVQADLRVEVNSQSASVQADGREIVIDTDSLAGGLALYRALVPGRAGSRLQRVRALARVLHAVGLTVSVRAGGRELLGVGTGARDWRLRLCGISHLRIRLVAVLAAALR